MGNREAQERLSELPTLPNPLEYLWDYFNDLSLTRDNYGWGPTRLKHREIEAWARNRKVTLDPWELDTLLRVDAVFLDVWAEAEAKRKQAEGKS